MDISSFKMLHHRVRKKEKKKALKSAGIKSSSVDFFFSGSGFIFGWKFVHQALSHSSVRDAAGKITGDKHRWKTYRGLSAWTATGGNSVLARMGCKRLSAWSLCVCVCVRVCVCVCAWWLLLVQRDGAVAQRRDPAVHVGLVCRDNTTKGNT